MFKVRQLVIKYCMFIQYTNVYEKVNKFQTTCSWKWFLPCFLSSITWSAILAPWSMEPQSSSSFGPICSFRYSKIWNKSCQTLRSESERKISIRLNFFIWLCKGRICQNSWRKDVSIKIQFSLKTRNESNKLLNL